MQEIQLAWAAKLEFLRMTNPFGSGEPEPTEQEKFVAAKEMRMGFRVAAMTRKQDAA